MERAIHREYDERRHDPGGQGLARLRECVRVPADKAVQCHDASQQRRCTEQTLRPGEGLGVVKGSYEHVLTLQHVPEGQKEESERQRTKY